MNESGVIRVNRGKNVVPIFKCQQCSQVVGSHKINALNIFGRDNFNYCPECGAKMNYDDFIEVEE